MSNYFFIKTSKSGIAMLYSINILKTFTNCQIVFLSIFTIPSIKSVCSFCTSQWLFYSVRWKDWFSCIWLLIILNSILFTTTFCLINYLCMYFSRCTTDFFYCFVSFDGKKRSMRCDVDKVKGASVLFFFFFGNSWL